MSRVRVKICGISTASALEAAVNAGVDAIGFVLSSSPRQVSPDQASALMRRLPPWVSSVVVTRQPEPGFGQDVIAKLGPHWWQSDFGDFTEQVLPVGTRALPVIREGDTVDHQAFDGGYVYEGVNSGQGETVDWQRAAQIAMSGRMVLAGGLDPDNVAAAITTVGPWAVDVSSGVESEPGIKDPDRIKAFMVAVTQGSQLAN